MLLVAPVAALLTAAGFIGPALLAALITVALSSLPDADIELANETEENSWLPGWIYSPLFIIIGLALAIHNLASVTLLNRLSAIDRSSHTIQHRGITHTVWFGIATSIGLILIITLGLTGLAGVVIYTDTPHPPISIEPARLTVYSLALCIGPTCAVIFHSVGDAVTPSGVGFIDPTAAKSLDRFRYDNFLANGVANKFGIVVLPMAFIGGYAVTVGHLSASLLLGGFCITYILFLPLWIWLPQTRIGKWIGKAYQFLT
jgi:uncharacterized metal-binding protein